ncbi:hypothetical protein DCS_03976 [Drechmeria coniospora]|uniref:Uncharacterized protein n=1 Tax=Drechmeria coniospora TaxID=98403 RepID=A0A151GIR5_DRECN|nr:hypothetical protein DCS_03976 [Drechmeria coniospora]KYK56969.1 hypothetical protein DCS_03976 [Drechmeria coniospora]
MNKLACGDFEHATIFQYHTLIAFLNSGGITSEALVNEAMAQIDQEPSSSKEKACRHKCESGLVCSEHGVMILIDGSFVAIQQRQVLRDEPWPQAGGYVDGVVDNRQSDYIRFYVGQSRRLAARIAIEHSGEICNRNMNTLHYFVLAQGHGHRSARFLRLWTAPSLELAESSTEDDRILATARYRLLQNVLEMTFCRCFGSLPGRVLAGFFGPGDYANVGLNNLPPLFEGCNIPAFIRHKYSQYHQESPDPDISGFAQSRKSHLAIKRNTRRFSGGLLKADYLQAMEQLASKANLDPTCCVPCQESFELSTAPADVEVAIQELDTMAALEQPQVTMPLVAPRGSWKAKIGIVINSEAIAMKSDKHDAHIQPLHGFGLTESNSLTWTSSLQAVGSGPSMFENRPDLWARIIRLNHFIIMGSNVKVVVLCGLKVQHDVLSAFQTSNQLSGPHRLCLRDKSHSIWLLTGHGNRVCKVLVTSPEPLAWSFLQDYTKLRQLRDVFGLVRALTGENIKHTCWENACFFAALFAQRRREKEEGIEPLTAGSLGLVFRDWLQYRGFVDDYDIRELERVSGNLTLGLLWITGFLVNRSKRQDGAKISRNRGYRGIYDPEAYQKTHDLFNRIYEKRLAAVGAFYSRRQAAHTAEAVEEEDANMIEDGVRVSQNYCNGEMNIVDDVMISLVNDQDSEVNIDTSGSQFVDETDGIIDLVPSIRSRHLSFDQNLPRKNRRPGALRAEISFRESLMLRKSLMDLMTETGMEQKATRRIDQKVWRLQVCYSLVSFALRGDDCQDFTEAPLFAIRGNLSKAGTPHPNCIYPQYDGCISSDPCIRLALQYRLIQGKTGEGVQQAWRWAEVSERGLRQGSDVAERISKANTLVDLLEGKTPNALVGVPRRSLLRWMYNHYSGDPEATAEDK